MERHDGKQHLRAVRLELVEAPEQEPLPQQPAEPGRQQTEIPAPQEVRSALHFVGFRGDEYTRAVRIWGTPSFIHRVNDPRMRRELHPTDTIIFANGHEAKPAERNGQDLNEEGYL